MARPHLRFPETCLGPKRNWRPYEPVLIVFRSMPCGPLNVTFPMLNSKSTPGNGEYWAVFSRLIGSIGIHAAVPPVIIILIAIYLLTGVDDETEVSLLLIVFLVGASGGVTTTYLRLKDIPSDFPRTNLSSQLVRAIVQVYVSPVVAGIFAWVLYGLFVTEIIKGPLFPEFRGTASEYDSVKQVFTEVMPVRTLDAAKALLWAFVAGFSEKMVPNILDKLAKEDSKAQEDSK